MYDYIRVACCVPDIDVGNVTFNEKKIAEMAEKSAKEKADIIVFPELAVTGYTCGDLFNQSTLQKKAREAVLNLKNLSGKIQKTIILGTPLVINGQLFNCAVILSDGKICGIVPKTFLPNVSEFYEKRWFASCVDLEIKEITERELGISEDTEKIPCGNDIIFNLNNEVIFGAEICEDLWTPLPPSTFSALGGAEVLFNISASNETIAKRKYRRDLVLQQSARNIAAYVYVSAGTTESTTDLIFSGHSAVAENGTVIAQNENYLDSDYVMFADIDLGKLRADRIKNKSFKDSRNVYGKAFPMRTVYIESESKIESAGEKAKISKLPFVPSAKKDRIERCMNIFEMQVAGLKKRLQKTGCRPVIGISGGLDSTLALLVAVKAVKELDRDSENVIGITMPCFGTSDRTYNNALKLMDTLGVTSVEINIKEACRLHFDDIGQDESVHDVTYENVQARERTQVLMDYAGKSGGLVVGTGDLSELALGWCTYNADHMSMYGVNASIPKTLVRWMIDSIIEYDVFSKSTEVLKDVLDTPISPELLPPDETGKIAQETENIVGPYALHDFFLYYVLRYGFTPEKIFVLAVRAFKNEFDKETVLKWLRSFYRRFFTQQFKRSCLPDGVKVGSVCLSPRGDWRMPSDASAEIWLNAVDNIKI